MSLRDAIAALVAAAPLDGTVPVRWLAEQLAADGATDTTPALRSTDVAIDQTIAQVAVRFGRKPSTVRTWAERGALPGAYRLNGREWRIPQSAIDALQRTQAAASTTLSPSSTEHAPSIGDWRKHLPRAS